MSALDSSILRTILSEIFFSIESRPEGLKYIVPKQGNWYNPQDTEDGKISTWIAYSISERNSILKARQEVDEDGNILNILNELVEIQLQFVGTEAEKFAYSVMHWPKRGDVADAFDIVSGQIRDDRIGVIASWFKQEGLNTTYAYNTRVRVYCANVQETGANRLLHFTANGKVF